MSSVRQAIRLALAMAAPRRMLLVRGPRRSEGGRQAVEDGATLCPEIALTFDDGPHPGLTPRVLDALAEHGLKATLFVIGQYAAQHPRLIRRMISEGHTVGNHTWTHSEPAETTAQNFLREVRRTRSLLEDLTGMDCPLVRPPKGKLSVVKLAGLWKESHTVVLWNVDPRDYRMESAEQMQAWTARQQFRQGDLVLLHDNQPWGVHAVEGIAAASARTVTIPEWLDHPPTDTSDTPEAQNTAAGEPASAVPQHAAGTPGISV